MSPSHHRCTSEVHTYAAWALTNVSDTSEHRDATPVWAPIADAMAMVLSNTICDHSTRDAIVVAYHLSPSWGVS